MPATRDQLHKVGFSPAQSEVLVVTTVATATLKQLVRAGFTGDQSRLLKANPSFRDLLVKGKFTRKQAALLLELT